MKEQIQIFIKIIKSVAAFALGYYVLGAIITLIAGREWASVNGRLITTIAMAAAAVLVLTTLDKEDILEERKIKWYKILLTVVVGAVTSVGFNYLIGLIPWKKIPISGAAADTEPMYAIPLWLVMIAYSVIAPITEEFLFRGGIYSRFKKVMPVPVAIVLTALIFGVYHGNLQQGLYAFVMGLLITYSYEKGKNIVYPIVFHAAANMTVSILHMIL